MRTAVSVLGVVVLSVLAGGAQTEQQPPNSPAWAFPLFVERGLPEAPGPQSLPGSDRTYTMEEIDDLFNAPDWYPDQRPDPPDIILRGHGDAMACGSCHLMSGLGHPESSDLTGLTVDYFMQQMDDFRSGARFDPGKRMNVIASGVSDEEARAAAEWFASLERREWTRVIEADTVPVTFIGPGRARFVDPNAGMEPIGNRIITVPEDEERHRLRDPNAGYIAYVPPGSLARGQELVETGGGGRTVACALCHGRDLRGLGNVPRLAGMHPIYTARQLYMFQDDRRSGIDAELMTPSVEDLTDEDIVAISAYLASLEP